MFLISLIDRYYYIAFCNLSKCVFKILLNSTLFPHLVQVITNQDSDGKKQVKLKPKHCIIYIFKFLILSLSPYKLVTLTEVEHRCFYH